MSEIAPLDNRKSLALVGKYATPLAATLVAMGIFFSQPVPYLRNMAIGCLLFGFIFNFGFVFMLKKGFQPKPWMPIARQQLNVVVNSFMVYFLGDSWHPMWLLLALTPIATAVYSSRGRTLLSGILIAALLPLIQLARQVPYPLVDWGKQFAYGIFIILISLLINELTRNSNPAVQNSPDK